MPSARFASIPRPPTFAYEYRGSFVWVVARFLVFSVSNTSHDFGGPAAKITRIRGTKWKALRPIRSKYAQQQSTILTEKGFNASAVRYLGAFPFFQHMSTSVSFSWKMMLTQQISTFRSPELPNHTRRDNANSADASDCLLWSAERIRRRFSDSHGFACFALVKMGYGP